MEVTIKDKVYRTGRLNAFQQFHVARKLAPAIMAMAQVVPDLPSAERMDQPEMFLAKAFMPIAQAISSMSEKDSEYILHTCLAACERQVPPSGWARVFVPGAGLAFQQGPEAIGLPELMQLTVSVIKENLGDFFPGVQLESKPS